MGQALPTSYMRLMPKPVESVDWKQEASEFTRSMNLTSLIEWQKFYTSGEKLRNIPGHHNQRQHRIVNPYRDPSEY
ncbi:MAG: hypothetical protein WA667_05290 [Candidatus Nitrosopolaris sp.]